MEAALEAMRAAGAEIVDGLELDLSETRGKSYEVLLYEFKQGLNAYLADPAHGSRFATLAELIAFNDEHAAEQQRQ